PARSAARHLPRAGLAAAAGSAETREAHALLERGPEEIAHLREAVGQVAEVEGGGVEVRPDLRPGEGRGDRGAVHAPRRVGRDDRLAVAVLEAIEVEPPLPLGLAALDRDRGED